MSERADAQRNRAELLRVGAATLAELGTGASTREIAKRAGLATGTFFRHFPTKDDLISAIMVDHYDRMTAIAEDLAASVLPPRAALEAYMENAASQLAPDRGYFQVVLAADADDESFRSSSQALDEAIGHLLVRAQDDGAVRADIVANDIHMLVQAATATVASHHGARPDLWRRYIALVLDGLGPDARPLPAPPLSAPVRAA